MTKGLIFTGYSLARVPKTDETNAVETQPQRILAGEILPPEKLALAGDFRRATWAGGLLKIKDYRLTTAEILYHMPDHPSLLQTYVWQDMDLNPEHPELRRFLDFWRNNLDGKLHSIRVGTAEIVRTGNLRNAQSLQFLS